MSIRIRSRIAAALAIGLAAGLVSCAQSPQTSYMNDAGETVTVNWKDYPAYAWVAAEDVLALPSAEQAETRYAELLSEVRAALEVEFGVSDWKAHGNPDDYDLWFPAGGNGYGGESMLTTFNSQNWFAEADFAPEEWERVIDVVAELAGSYGVGERTLEEIDQEYAVWMRSESLHSSGEWLTVAVQDARLDPTGAAIRDAEKHGWFVSGISFSYGITTIRGEDRAEFERRAAPFAGLDRPAETHSD